MNKPSGELHKLIHSLTTNEKGLFKKFASRHSATEKIYVALFDAIEKQKTYNETSLRKTFKNIAVVKNYLKEMILECLMLSDLGGSVQHAIDRNMGFTRILISKGLTTAAQKLIEQSLQMTTDNDLFDKKLIILGQKNALQIREVPPNEKWKFIRDRYEEEAYCEEQRTYITRLLFEQRKIFFLIEERNTGGRYKHLIKDIDAKFLENGKGILSTRGRIIWLNTLGAYYDLINHHEKKFKTFSTNLAIAKKLYKTIGNESAARQYSTVLTNYINVAFSTGHMKEAKTEIHSLINLDTKNSVTNNNNLFQYVRFIQELAFNERRFEWGVKETMKHLSSSAMKEKILNHLVISHQIYKNLALLQLMTKSHQQAFLTIQDIFNLNKTICSSKCELDTLLLNVILQAEMGNMELLPALVYSTKRRIKKEKPSKPFVQIIRLLEKYKGDDNSFNSLCNNKTYDYLIFDKLNFRDWLEARVKRIPLAEMARFQSETNLK